MKIQIKPEEIRSKIFNSKFEIETVAETIEQIFSNSSFSIPAKTGFDELDDILEGGLYPETINFIGAAPSLGKTTLALQMGSNMAYNKTNVLFFSLENSSKQNSIKNISRINYIIDNKLAIGFKEIANSDIRNNLPIGNKRNLLLATEEYRKINQYFKQVYGRSQMTVDNLIDIIIKYMEENIFDNPPVIIIDYIQQLKNSNKNATEKETVDYATESLKALATYYKIAIVCLSTIARIHYLEDLELNCFKETGGIEYGADIAIVIQFPPVNGKVTEGLINFYRAEDFKNIELKILKDRNGGTSYKRLKFTLKGKYNILEPGYSGKHYKNAFNAITPDTKKSNFKKAF